MHLNTRTASATQDRSLCAFLMLAIAILTMFALWTASVRHLHIDEPHNVFTMQLVMAWSDPGAGNPVDLHHVIGGLITRSFPSASQHYLVLRLIFSMIFVFTMLGVGFARPITAPVDTTSRAPQTWWILAPATIALTMGSVWLHGFEIRHDLFQAAGVVAFVGLIRAASRRPYGWGGRWLAALIVVIMQLTSHKAFTLWIPAMLFLAFVAGRHSENRDGFSARCLSLIFELGRLAITCVAAALAGLSIMAAAGSLYAYLDRLRDFTNYSTTSDRFSSSPAFETALISSPVATMLASIAIGSAIVRFSRQWKVSWLRAIDTMPVSVVMLLVCIMALEVNPKPFSYNLVWLSAGIAVAAAEGLQSLLDRWWQHRILVVILLVSASTVSLARITGAHWATQTMHEQMLTIAAVEALTEPHDTVLDGTGLVSSRKAPTRDWILHSLFMSDYRKRKREQFADVIEREFPPVIVRGHYRWAWLLLRDKNAADAWYRPVSPTLWVLGYDLDSPKDSTVEIKRVGRYEISGATQLDGNPISDPFVQHLQAGAVQLSGVGAVTVRWIGPTLKTLKDAELPQTKRLYLNPSAPLLQFLPIAL
ncbi:MAG: hypothetical protein IV088_16335 [Hydrogenophaga sp.]|uniref:hypothetical protein n=1 Tax=Hydrogenophaga sp. TaxID=1904254 RepID=UPI0025C12CFD|nr:hypothetical protein [Hydrogenophaga sp.]MBT9552420.1 hypothetical protein [Hydrogenophaga sp.]